MIRVFYGEVTGLTEDIFENKKCLLTSERIQRIERCRQKEDKQRSFGAGLLLEYGLKTCGFSQKEVELSKNPDGKYYIVDHPEVCFNLTHAGDYVAAVFDDQEVGIDIEWQREAKLQVARRFFAENEYAMLKNADSRDEQEKLFTRIWTRKESYIKAIGLGMRKDLRSFTTIYDELEGTDFFFHTYVSPENYTISICSKKKEFPETIEYVDLLAV